MTSPAQPTGRLSLAGAARTPDATALPAPAAADRGQQLGPSSDPEAWQLADAAAAECLLRCWVREVGVRRPADGVLRLDLHAAGARVEAEIAYWSSAGWHRFGRPRLDSGAALDAVSLAALLVAEAGGGRLQGAEHRAELVGRVAESARRVAGYIGARRAHPGTPAGTPPFLAMEQAPVLGHPLHPAPKSRTGLSDAEAGSYSPELRGSFPLHWFAADPSVVLADAAGATRAEEITAQLARGGPSHPAGSVLIPCHPWQARAVRTRPSVRELLEAGLIRDLGPGGPEWHPTVSVRTVYRPDAPVMLKLSLGLDITNSKRENLRVELRRGAEISRLLDAGLGAALAAAHPGFGIVRDPAWLAVDTGGRAAAGAQARAGTTTSDAPESGLEVVLRANPFGPDDRVACVAGLVAERPDLGRSGLAARVEDLAARTGHPVPDVAEEWFARYLHAVVEPVLWFYGAYGIGLEAHQQNTLVALDEDGWPCGGWYRDNQGYYLSASRAGELERFLPGVGRDGDSRCEDAVIDERIGYYVGINNVLGLIGAFGSQWLAAERRLLARFRALLVRMHRAYGENLRLAAILAESPTLRCKANLLTRVNGLDELVGPLASQSVYRDIPNPIAQVPG